jgi:hypothetical protein
MAMTPEDMAHLNFMKKQQWNVAYYALLLLAAVFAVKKAFEPLPLVDWEKRAGTALCALVLLLGILLLFFIQCDIGKHRKRIGRDADAYSQGLEFTVPLGLTIIVACCTIPNPNEHLASMILNGASGLSEPAVAPVL